MKLEVLTDRDYSKWCGMMDCVAEGYYILDKPNKKAQPVEFVEYNNKIFSFYKNPNYVWKIQYTPIM